MKLLITNCECLIEEENVVTNKSNKILLHPRSGNETIYQHEKGLISDNAILALLHDKLFRQRIEKKRKGKGSYQRREKHAKKYFENPIIKFLSVEI